jgi:hypothetical protein
MVASAKAITALLSVKSTSTSVSPLGPGLAASPRPFENWGDKNVLSSLKVVAFLFRLRLPTKAEANFSSMAARSPKLMK